MVLQQNSHQVSAELCIEPQPFPACRPINISQGRHRAHVASFYFSPLTFCKHLKIQSIVWHLSADPCPSSSGCDLSSSCPSAESRNSELHLNWWIPVFTMTDILFMPPKAQLFSLAVGHLPSPKAQMWHVGGSRLHSYGGCRTEQFTCCQLQDHDTATLDRKRTGKRSWLPDLMVFTATVFRSKLSCLSAFWQVFHEFKKNLDEQKLFSPTLVFFAPVGFFPVVQRSRASMIT